MTPGARFGSLTVVTELQSIRAGRLYECRCDCGGTAKVTRRDLAKGIITACKTCRREQARRVGLVPELEVQT